MKIGLLFVGGLLAVSAALQAQSLNYVLFLEFAADGVYLVKAVKDGQVLRTVKDFSK